MQQETTRVFVQIALGLAIVAASSCAKKKDRPAAPTGHGVAAPKAPAAKAKAVASSKEAPPSKKVPPSSAPAATSTIYQVVDRYFAAAKSGDLSSIHAIVDPACRKGRIGRIEATKMLGARLVVERLTRRVERSDKDEATVGYALWGHLDPQQARHKEKNIFGKEQPVKVPSFVMRGVSKRGRLRLIRQGGAWIISCKKK